MRETPTQKYSSFEKGTVTVVLAQIIIDYLEGFYCLLNIPSSIHPNITQPMTILMSLPISNEFHHGALWWGCL